MKTLRVPEATITRISVYSRYLEQLDRKGVVTVSSVEIAEGVGVSPAQVRKDLAYFGEFGTRGVGYNVKDLRHYTSKILNLNEPWPLVVVGAGNLGFALSTYKGFNNRGFSVVGIFDNDLTKIGKKIVDLEVSPPEKMPEIIAQHKVKIGIIAVPASAQDMKLTYPETRKTDLVETRFGAAVADPYRWLENDVRTDPEVADFLRERMRRMGS